MDRHFKCWCGGSGWVTRDDAGTTIECNRCRTIASHEQFEIAKQKWRQIVRERRSTHAHSILSPTRAGINHLQPRISHYVDRLTNIAMGHAISQINDIKTLNEIAHLFADVPHEEKMASLTEYARRHADLH